MPALVARYLTQISRRLRLQDGLEAIEYALIAAILAAVLVISVPLLGSAISGAFAQISAALTDEPVGTGSTTP